MRERLYLSLLVGVLLCLAGWAARAQLQRSGTARQGWDYKWVSLARGTTELNWSLWTEDDQPLRGPVNIAPKIKGLGDQGWELVSVTPYSNHVCNAPAACAGYTSQVTYFFKRPK